MQTFKIPKIAPRDLPTVAKSHDYILKGRLALQARKRALEKREEEFDLDWLIDIFTDLEGSLEKVIHNAYKSHILHPELSRIKGLGPELGGKLIGLIESVSDGDRTGIACFDTLSKLWAFSGFGVPVEKRVSGEKIKYNVALKHHLYKIARSFIFQNNKFYQLIYVPRLQHEERKFNAIVSAKKGEVKELPEGVTTKLHIHQRARRVMVKFFLGCLYYHWRDLLGIPSRVTYAEEKLGIPSPYRYRLGDFLDK